MGSESSKIYNQNAPGSKSVGDGEVHISTLCHNGELFDLGPNDPKTTYEAFLHGEKVSGNGPFLGTRNRVTNEYEFLSYSEVSDLCNAFGSGLVSFCGLRSSNSTYVGIFSQNRKEWFIADQACARFSLVPVPIYGTLGEEAMTHIVTQAQLSLIICDTASRALQLAKMGLRPLRSIVVIDAINDQDREQIEAHVTLYSFTEVMEKGLANLQELNPAQPEDVCTISYTSGTTGVPKGVVLTHRALCLTVASARMSVERDGDRLGPEDVTLSYLPAAHVYERMNMILMSLAGGRIGYFGGDVTKLFDDVRDVAPTLFSAVPRILYKIYDKIHSEASQSSMKAKVLQWATDNKLASLEVGQLRSDTVWDSLVFQKVRDIFGGRVRYLTTGSAGVSVEVLNFFRVALSCSILSGYGQTESGGCSSLSSGYDFRGDHVGGPIPCVMIKLEDVPDLDYFASKGFGEVCVKGKNLFREYYKMPDKTQEVLDADGWLHTGDIGQWTRQGNLKIVDRCKMIFKLSQGEYIAPEKVEGVMQRCSHISQVFIDGKSDKDYLVAVVVPDFDVVAKSLGTDSEELDKHKLCRNMELKRIILEEIETVGRSSGLKGFELAKKIHLHPEPFSMENGLLTVTMKSKRNELRKRFFIEIDELYSEE